MTNLRRTCDDDETKHPTVPTSETVFRMFSGPSPARNICFFICAAPRNQFAGEIQSRRHHRMKKPNRTYEPHLALKEVSLRPGAEWAPRWTGWTLIHVSDGAGYYLQPDFNQELETGSALLLNGDSSGVVRASNLTTLTLHAFSVMPTRLTGLLTLSEQKFFQMAASRRDLCLTILPPPHPVA